MKFPYLLEKGNITLANDMYKIITICLIIFCAVGCNKSTEIEEFTGFFNRFKADKEFSLKRTNFPISSIKHAS